MNIINLENRHVEEAMELALSNYRDEQQFVKELPHMRNIPDLNEFAENGLGVAAFENKRMEGGVK